MEKIVEVKNLDVVFPLGKTYFKAVKNASFHINNGEILGLVGESGSGKSTIGRTLMGINSFVNGSIKINDTYLPNNIDNISKIDRSKMIKNIQYIFQNPLGALNPNKTIRKALEDVFKANFNYKKYKAKYFLEILDKKLNKEDFISLFNSKYELIFESKSQKSHEEKINDKYFIKQRNALIDFKNNKEILIHSQKNKKLTDKEYLIERRKLIKAFKQNMKEINNETNLELNNLIDEKNILHINLNDLKLKLALLVVDDKTNDDYIKKALTISKHVNLNLSSKFKKAFSQSVVEYNKIKFKSIQEIKTEEIKKSANSASLNWDLLDKKPADLSGGQQQRAVITRASLVHPKIIVADEPISALDISIQSQIIDSLKEQRIKFGTTILFIAHDLHVVRHISDRIIVIYRGEILEEGKADEIFNNPMHPYTRSLLLAIPDVMHSELPNDTKFKFEQNSTKREWISLSKTHKVFCTNDELNVWKKVKHA